MGNKLCKRRGNECDPDDKKENAVDRIMSRLCLRPNSWTTDLHRSKQVSRSSRSKFFTEKENTKPIPKSTDWIEASLEVPEKDISMGLENSKLAIFSTSETGTPVPPPRKQKPGIKEKIEAAAKSGLLALSPKKSIEEPLCIKKKINYYCPCHDPKHKHNHEPHHNTVQEKNIVNKKEQKVEKSKKSEKDKESKRRKNLSVVSLPNYNDLKFTVANFTDIDGNENVDKQIKSSNISLPQEAKSGGSKSYMVRCRSFGSLLPQQLLEKLKPTPIVVPSAESDDSFAALEDWDLDLIEHYNPRDASLPRPRRPVPKSEKNILSDIENQIVKEEIESLPESPKVASSNDSTETLLLADTSSKKSLNSETTSSVVEPSSFNSLEMYDSIEDYVNRDMKKFTLTESPVPEVKPTVSLNNNNFSKEIKLETKMPQGFIEQFLQAEKMNVNNS